MGLAKWGSSQAICYFADARPTVPLFLNQLSFPKTDDDCFLIENKERGRERKGEKNNEASPQDML
jgi:hypothetical protein